MFIGASDATYHIMWIVLFKALDDFGIREVNDVVRTGSPGNEHPKYHEVEAIKKKVGDDALHGALRIAGLARIYRELDYIYVADMLCSGRRVDHQRLSGKFIHVDFQTVGC